MKKSAFAANRTVALGGFDVGGCRDGKSHPAAAEQAGMGGLDNVVGGAGVQERGEALSTFSRSCGMPRSMS